MVTLVPVTCIWNHSKVNLVSLHRGGGHPSSNTRDQNILMVTFRIIPQYRNYSTNLGLCDVVSGYTKGFMEPSVMTGTSVTWASMKVVS